MKSHIRDSDSDSKTLCGQTAGSITLPEVTIRDDEDAPAYLCQRCLNAARKKFRLSYDPQTEDV